MAGDRIKAVEELALLMAIPAPSAASLREGFANEWLYAVDLDAFVQALVTTIWGETKGCFGFCWRRPALLSWL